MVDKFEKRFDGRDTPETYMVQLMNSKQGSSETLEEYAERIEMLAVKAGDHMDEAFIVHRFCHGVADKEPALVCGQSQP